MNSEKIEKFDQSSRIWTRKTLLIVLGLVGVGILIRSLYLEPGIPVTFDALSHFFYAKDISITGSLPPNYSPANNGWPIFMSFFFKIFSFENTFHYMELQRWLSIIISTLTIIPVYALSRKFFDEKVSIVTSSIFIFEPRLIYNSLFGITEPLYILLGTISMVLFLSDKNKIIYASFAIVALTSLIRSEGLFLFFAISILFFIKFRKDRHLAFLKYLPALAIFLLILIPMTLYRIDAGGFDSLFGRIVGTVAYVSQDPAQTGSTSGIPYVATAFENFVKFLGWDLIPLFIFFVPVGIFIYFRNFDFKKLTLLIFAACLSLPALHAYGGSNLDTRYLFMFYPIFCVISGFTIAKIFNYVSKKQFLVVTMVSLILIGSVSFLEIREMNFELEEEYHQISKKIVTFKPVINDFYPASRYLETAEITDNSNELEEYFFKDRKDGLSIRFTIPHNTIIVQMEDLDFNEYFKNAKQNSLTHLAIDLEENRPAFFKHILENEKKYPFLEKVYDSKDQGFDYQIKIFKIDYEALEILS